MDKSAWGICDGEIFTLLLLLSRGLYMKLETAEAVEGAMRIDLAVPGLGPFHLDCSNTALEKYRKT